MNGTHDVWLFTQENSDYTSVVCRNSLGGTCYILYAHKLSTGPRLCHRLANPAVFDVCHDCPLISAFELAYTEIMRKKHVQDK